MGIGSKISRYERDVLEHFGKDYNGLVWCELGNQRRWGAKQPAKNLYEKWGVHHTSIDLNGCGGALILDLDCPVPVEMLNKFDIVTNYGTIEHVNNQYQVFKNTHDMCKIGGLMIHAFPMRHTYSGHCRYYYSEDFVDQLSNGCKYDVYGKWIFDMSRGTRKKLLLTITLVKGENWFVSPGMFSAFDIHDSGDSRRTGNYVKCNSHNRPK